MKERWTEISLMKTPPKCVKCSDVRENPKTEKKRLIYEGESEEES